MSHDSSGKRVWEVMNRVISICLFFRNMCWRMYVQFPIAVLTYSIIHLSYLIAFITGLSFTVEVLAFSTFYFYAYFTYKLNNGYFVRGDSLLTPEWGIKILILTCSRGTIDSRSCRNARRGHRGRSAGCRRDWCCCCSLPRHRHRGLPPWAPAEAVALKITIQMLFKPLFFS